MKKAFFVVLLLAVVSASAKKLSVAVTDFQAQGLTPEEVTVLSDRFRGELFSTGQFLVMERAQMQAIIQEQGFQQSGACASDACLVQMGQLLGVEKLVAGSIGRLGAVYMVNVRIIDMTTGKIEHTAAEDCRCEIEGLIGSMVQVSKKLALLTSGNAPLESTDQGLATKRQETSEEATEHKNMDQASLAPKPKTIPTTPAPKLPIADTTPIFRRYYIIKISAGSYVSPTSNYAKYFDEFRSNMLPSSDLYNDLYDEIGFALEMGISPRLRFGVGYYELSNGGVNINLSPRSEYWYQSISSVDFGLSMVFGKKLRWLLRYDLSFSNHSVEVKLLSSFLQDEILEVEQVMGLGQRFVTGAEWQIFKRFGIGTEFYIFNFKIDNFSGVFSGTTVDNRSYVEVLGISDGVLNLSGGGMRLNMFWKL